MLALRYSAEELKGKTVAAKIRLVYQTGIDQEYEDVTEARQRVALDKIRTTEHRAIGRELPEAQTQGLNFLRSMFEKQCIYSMPSASVEQCRADANDAIIVAQPPHTCVLDATKAVLEPAPEIRFRDDIQFSR